MNNTYRIYHGGQEKGPYTFEQLRSMWSAGHLTADTLYWQEGMADWQPLHELGLDLAIQPISPPVRSFPAQPTRLPTHHVHHTGKVATKSHGSGVVAVGSIMCFVGTVMIFTPMSGVGGFLLFIGFFVAVVGRMMS
jgi:hypothetical protein